MSSVGAGAPAPDDVVAQCVLGEERDMPRQTRRLVREALGEELAHLADDVGMVVTELATNALLHGSPPAELTMRVLADGAVRLELTDTSPVLPVRARADQAAMTGRGLALVDAIADRWGVQRLAVGKVVWAELRGATETPIDVDVDDLLAGWPDLEDQQAWEPAGVEHYTVYLGEVPTDLLLAAKAHVDNLVREFSLAAAGARTGTTAAVPPHLAELIDTVVHRFAAPRESIKRQALAAAHAGEDHVRLELRLPLDAAQAGEEYLRALDQADDYCRAARLLTLESPPQHRVFRRWYIEELIGQLDRAASGETPVPNETFEQRLLHEIDAIAEAERKAERSARLHELSSVLASAVTPGAVTEAVLGQGVASLRASGGAMLLASSGPVLALPGAVGYPEDVVSRLRSEPVDADLPAAVAMRTRQPVWLETREERDARFPELARMEPETVSMCAVPLLVTDRCLGALRFSFSESRLFDQEEREFVTSLAAQTAQALDRAQLYAQRVAVSERLQASLLPPRLPVVPGVTIEAAYDPLGHGVDVGGDFYDVWACGDHRWAFAIGDASGTGPDAAAMTALVRHTLRALTLNDASLDTVLHQLNRALLDARRDEDEDRFCTVLLGFLKVQGNQAILELVSGGHCGPVLVSSREEPRELELAGSLLGLFAPAEVDRRTVALEPGDELVLYTDGVTDTRRGAVFFDVEGILDAVRTARLSGRSTVATVMDAVRGHAQGHTDDDVAVLSIRFDGRADGA